MSQDFIHNILKKNKGKWFCKHDLKPIVPFNNSNIIKGMSRIVKYKDSYKVQVKKGKRGIVFLKY